MSEETRRHAGWLIIILPTVIFGGASLLSLLIEPGSSYHESAFRRDMWRVGHAHAGILLILSLLAYLYVDKARLSAGMKRFCPFCYTVICHIYPCCILFIGITTGCNRTKCSHLFGVCGCNKFGSGIDRSWYRTCAKDRSSLVIL